MSSGQPAPHWAKLLASHDAPEVATALAALVANQQSPSTLQQARALTEHLQRHGGDPAVAGPALALLARWARQAAAVLQQPGAADEETAKVLQQGVDAALRVVAAAGVQQGAGPAAALFLGAAAEGCPQPLRWQITEVLGTALLGDAAGPGPAAATELPARDLIGGLASLLPALMDTPVAACWVLSALLSACQLNPGAMVGMPPATLADDLAPLYGMMRSVVGAAVARANPTQAVARLLQPLAAVLAVAITEATVPGEAAADPAEAAAAAALAAPGAVPPERGATPPLPPLPGRLAAAAPDAPAAAAAGMAALQSGQVPLLAPAAAAVLCLGGLLEGLMRSAPGFPPSQALAQEAEEVLLLACEAAAAWDLDLENGSSSGGSGAVPQGGVPTVSGGPQQSGGPPAAVGSSGGRAAPDPAAAAQLQRLARAAVGLLRDSCSLATVLAFQGCGRPSPGAATMHCQAATLLRCALTLDPLFGLAAARGPPGLANSLLQRQLGSAPMQHAAELAGSVAHSAKSAPASERAALAAVFRRAADRAFNGYRAYITSTPGGWLGAVDPQALKSILDRLFMSATVVLSAVWDAAQAEAAAAAAAAATGAPPPDPAAAPPPLAGQAALLLAVFADLQFARLPLDLYAGFLKDSLGAVAGCGDAAQLLASCFPPYAELAAPCEARGGAPVWLIDAVAASKIQFLMSVVMPCAHLIPAAVICEQLAPLALLYLLHPHPATSAASHQLLAALLPAVPLKQREPLAAFYIDRAMEGYPGATALETLQQGLASVLCALPPGSMLGVYCVETLLHKCRALEAGGRDSELVLRLFGLAAGLLLVVDASLLGPAMTVVGGYVEVVPPGSNSRAALLPALLGAVFDVVSHTDDAVRKPALVAWYQRLAACQLQHQAGQQARAMPPPSAA